MLINSSQAWAADPMEIPRLKGYFDDLPTLGGASKKPRPVKKISGGALKLDEDIVLEVFLYLSSEDIENVQLPEQQR